MATRSTSKKKEAKKTSGRSVKLKVSPAKSVTPKKSPVKSAKVQVTPKAKAPAKKRVVKSVTPKKSPVKSAKVQVTPKAKAPAKQRVVKSVTPKKSLVKSAKVQVAPKAKAPAKKRVVKSVEKNPSASLYTKKIKPAFIDEQAKSPVRMTNVKPANVGVPASISKKKRLVISYDKMSEDFARVFRAKYPRGYSDYMGDLFKVDKPDGTSFYAITMETEDAVYLVKMVVKVDRVDDAQQGLFPDVAEEVGEATDTDTFPDNDSDNVADLDDDMDE